MTDETEQPTGEARPGPEATEAARELAAANMVDLEHVHGTGADGKITKADVEEHLNTGAVSYEPPPVEVSHEPPAAADTAAPEPVSEPPSVGGHAPKIWTGPRR